ncbi:hypothetical protein O6H91_11G093500 [Diphasiastrum complanatum]|uniref:Uncharacterized protein n=1 Tax=Diphasiastrum complanatum TaxID=34168 RepID=A0ACC2CBY0_DIPCM|nr:hypothetical protein O6H91_11G093500 [Diphasiastrum complanatum]
MPLFLSCIPPSSFFLSPTSSSSSSSSSSFLFLPSPLRLSHATLYPRRSLSSPSLLFFTSLPLSAFLSCALSRINDKIGSLDGQDRVEVVSKHATVLEGFCCFDFKSKEWLRLMSSLLVLVVAGNVLVESAFALEQGPPPAEKNELIQKLLEKSRANKAKYDKERRDAYYKRNYKDYFEFVEGSIRKKGQPSEAEKGILEWLERNK